MKAEHAVHGPLLELARRFVQPDLDESKRDVQLRGARGAAEYWAYLAASQPGWEILETSQGLAALEAVAREIAIRRGAGRKKEERHEHHMATDMRDHRDP